MKLAIGLFNDVVTPRLDIAESFLIYDTEADSASNAQRYNLLFDGPGQLLRFLQDKGVGAVVCSSCPRFLQRILVMEGIDVICGVMGAPGDLQNLCDPQKGNGGRNRKRRRGHRVKCKK